MKQWEAVVTKQNLLFKEMKEAVLLRNCWPTVVGNVLATSLELSHIKNRQLIIMIDNPGFFKEIKLYETLILEKANGALNKKKYLTSIRLKLKQTGQTQLKRPFSVRKNYDNISGL